ncbi:hypothetical protein H4582DRAFT_2057960 [Lactarius indigo]|nr:hypothetical protein H4582DRAFT_2057960 [Lactarius indigo]
MARSVIHETREAYPDARITCIMSGHTWCRSSEESEVCEYYMAAVSRRGVGDRREAVQFALLAPGKLKKETSLPPGLQALRIAPWAIRASTKPIGRSDTAGLDAIMMQAHMLGNPWVSGWIYGDSWRKGNSQWAARLSGNTKCSCQFSGSYPRELWALGSLDPHRRGKSESKESVLVNDQAVDSRSMGEEAVPLENGEIRAKGADEWQNLRTYYSPKDFANTHLGLLLHLLAPHPAASRVDYDCGSDDYDDDAPSGLHNPSRRRFTPNFACFLNRLGGGAPQFVEAGKNVPRKAAPKLVIAASREPHRAASARTFHSSGDEGTAIGMKLETPKGKVEGQTLHAE